MARIHCTPRNRSAGFTLIEVLVTVAIISILATIAYPAYTDYVRRGQLPEAFSAMSDYRVKLETYFQDYRNYGTTANAACANGANAPKWNNFAPGGAQYFTYACTVNATLDGYTLTATGAKGQAIGHEYTVNQDNVRTTTKFKGQAVTKNCWVMRGDEC